MAEIRKLFLYDERLATFKSWPFDDDKECNAKSMAEAGFFYCGTGEHESDAAKCFLCGKELDGWDSSDDPWEEHESHAPKCAYVQLKKKEDDFLVIEYLSVLQQYMKNEAKRVLEHYKTELENKEDNIIQSLKKRNKA